MFSLQANGVANDNSISEKLNGDHKTIEVRIVALENEYSWFSSAVKFELIEMIFCVHFYQEIATSPEKLEKLAAANPPPSTEVVAAE